MYKALPLVISEHPALATILVDQPSMKKMGRKRTWQARLKRICFKDCVRFIDDVAGKEHFTQLLQVEHNTWFNTDDKTKPLWRVVVNGSQILFVFHHSVCDGRSGMIFHRSLLAALNKVTRKQEESGQEDIFPTDFNVPNYELMPESMALFRLLGMRFNIYIGLLSYLFSILVKFFLRKNYTFFTDVIFKDNFPSKDNPVPLPERPVTKLERICLSPSQLEASLNACKKHKTSFTALIGTLIHVTLACEVYPVAKLGLSYFAIDLRRFLPAEYSSIIGNYVSSHQSNQWLNIYRQAGAMSPAIDTQIAHMWQLSQRTKADLDSAMLTHHTPLPVANALGLTAIGEDDETIMTGIYHVLDVAVTKSFCVSSLVEPNFESFGPWQLESAEFSVSAQKSQVGPMLYFAMASVKDSQCVINVSYEEDILQNGVVRRILEGVERRLIMLLEAERCS
ncbi:hypothetical protein N7466_011129 [Penicillium verhagenii]|uniref:uncharacterized protein n=1 Tax=Penicillium verhagenii TaxID=1562060 RepID=UPI002544FE7D|nr:uncharacterized protein N7466_011129 [Penicillium verhagenii]KAJ5917575.1 hypothetical protein N7466_011129 [Penicillium verhagenii]